MNRSFRRYLLLLALAMTGCVAVGEEPSELKRPAPWTLGYTLFEDPAVLTSQITNVLSTRLDPEAFECVRMQLRFRLTPEVLFGIPKLEAYCDRRHNLIVYRISGKPGSPDDETVLHEIMHWVFVTERMPEADSFADDLSMFLASQEKTEIGSDIRGMWRRTLEKMGSQYQSRYLDEHYAYIGGKIACGEWVSALRDADGRISEHLWRHYRGIVALPASEAACCSSAVIATVASASACRQ